MYYKNVGRHQLPKENTPEPCYMSIYKGFSDDGKCTGYYAPILDTGKMVRLPDAYDELKKLYSGLKK